MLQKLFALLRYQKDTASLNPSSATNGSDQSSNRPPVGRPSTRTTQRINPLDPNLSFALPTQDTLLTGQRASTGLLLTSRNPSSLTNNADKAPPQQNLNFSYEPQCQDILPLGQQETARQPLTPRTTQPQQTAKNNADRTATPSLILEIDEDPDCGQPLTTGHAFTPNDPVYTNESSTAAGSIANKIRDLYLDFCYPHNTYGPPPSGLQHLGRIITGTYYMIPPPPEPPVDPVALLTSTPSSTPEMTHRPNSQAYKPATQITRSTWTAPLEGRPYQLGLTSCKIFVISIRIS